MHSPLLSAISGFRLLILTALLGAGAFEARGQTSPDYVEGEVIVTFKPTASKRTADSALQKKSLRFTRHFNAISGIRKRPMGLVRNGGRKTQELIQELKNDPQVESVEPNYIRRVKAAPNDSRFGDQWSLNNTGQLVDGTVGTSGADIKYLEAWTKARPPVGDMVVAVIDTGVDTLHSELSPRMWTNTQEIPNNNVDDDGNGYKDDYYGFDFVNDLPDPSDSGYHGTHVAGTIAAQGGNGQGIIGINDSVKIMALKVSDDGDTMSTSAVIEALEYAVAMKRRGVPLVAINASYGGSSFSNAERAAIAAVGEEKIILCAAAGNETTNNNTVPSYPANYRLPNMIVVASTTSKDTLSSFSNYGSTTVDLAAPGSSILSTKPSQITVNVGSSRYISYSFVFAGVTTGLSGKIYDCGFGYPADFPAAVSGQIALISRGTLTFAEKVANAKAAGAIAAIIYNNEPGPFAGTLQTAGDWIPARAIAQEYGQAIKALGLPVNGSIEVTSGYQFLDGTSMAAPHVAGAVAFAAQNYPGDTVAQRIQRILSTVDKKSSLTGKVITGGRLNLNRIVDANQDGVADWQASALNIVQNGALTGGVLGQAYSQTFTVAAATGTLAWSVPSGSLPPGVTLSAAGVLSGTPTQSGSFVFTALVTDEAANSGAKQFSLTIAATPPVVQTESLLPAGTTGNPYSAVLSGSGGTAPYTWSVTAGDLPPGLTLKPNGNLSGLPETAGSSTFTVKLTDAHQLQTEKEITLVIAQSAISIVGDAALPYGIKGEVYSFALAAEGGTAPYTWNVAEGSFPTGVQLASSGLVQGKPTVTGTFRCRVRVIDKGTGGAAPAETSKFVTLEIRSTYTAPTVNGLDLGSTAIGQDYRATVTATDYPRSFKIKGLPKGLSYSAKTGVISGRPKEAGNFSITASASNPAGSSSVVEGTLVVRTLDAEWTGSFSGIIGRDPAANQNLGSRFTLTTTSLGAYTFKVTTGAVTKSFVGFLSETDPQIKVSLFDQPLSLLLDSTTELVSGSHGTARVDGWRNGWHARNKPATDYAGYYSAALPPPAEPETLPSPAPLGTGFFTTKVSTAGIASVAGRTATGESFTSSGGLGPQGQMGACQPLYKNEGSITGLFKADLTEGFIPASNTLTGNWSWTKPADSTRSYAEGFSLTGITVSGGFLSSKAGSGLVLGLPAAGTASLSFTDGGLGLSDTEPDVSNFGYTDKFIIQMPTAGTPANEARASLAINKATGQVSGNFTLAEDGSSVKRKVSFLGMIIPDASGEIKAQGYFLLAQLPGAGEKATATPILSGGMQVTQP